MNAEELRRIQAPLKAKYREDPDLARITAYASGTLLHDRPACRVESSFGPVHAGLHPAAGGDGSDKCSIDMMLEAFVACAGVTFNLVATAMGIPFKAVKVIAEAEGDIRGALGVAKDVPVGMTAMTLRFEIDSPATDAQIATLIQQTERYCVVFQSLRNPPPVAVTVSRAAA
jgi:uncharacterized OsmC-like protein